jgi:hypothetical protein
LFFVDGPSAATIRDRVTVAYEKAIELGLVGKLESNNPHLLEASNRFAVFTNDEVGNRERSCEILRDALKLAGQCSTPPGSLSEMWINNMQDILQWLESLDKS